jgi:hypothetical protein
VPSRKRNGDQAPTGHNRDEPVAIPAPVRDREASPRRRTGLAAHHHARTGHDEMRDRGAVLHNLSRDPSLRFNESGRTVLKWLFARATGPDGWEKMIGAIPSHCAYQVADIARGFAEEWAAFAQHLEERLGDTGMTPASHRVRPSN